MTDFLLIILLVAISAIVYLVMKKTTRSSTIATITALLVAVLGFIYLPDLLTKWLGKVRSGAVLSPAGSLPTYPSTSTSSQ